jgi:hypothetical protein
VSIVRGVTRNVLMTANAIDIYNWLMPQPLVPLFSESDSTANY